jgi:hypothetical protein
VLTNSCIRKALEESWSINNTFRSYLAQRD